MHTRISDHYKQQLVGNLQGIFMLLRLCVALTLPQTQKTQQMFSFKVTVGIMYVFPLQPRAVTILPPLTHLTVMTFCAKRYSENYYWHDMFFPTLEINDASSLTTNK